MDTNGSPVKSDVYSRITNEIIRAIEVGVSTYEMPWHKPAGAGFPRNPVTGKVYRGINTLELWATSRLRGYGSPYYATYLQWKSAGAQVRLGEHGSIVVFYKRNQADAPREVDAEYEEAYRSRVLLRYSVVFNSEQVDGWEPPQYSSKPESLTTAETFIKLLGADVRYGSDTASYNPHFDCINMPFQSAFKDTVAGSAVEGFYAVLLHEHIHWSGHPSRLKRDLSGHFGSQAYAMEELVAELGAAFLCSTLDISHRPRPDHASYIASWLRVLKGHKSAVFVSAAAATKACSFLASVFDENYGKRKQ